MAKSSMKPRHSLKIPNKSVRQFLRVPDVKEL